MLAELKQLQERLETNGEKLYPEELSYLEQIKTVDDLRNYDKASDLLRSLSYDAALALGLSWIEAEDIAGDYEAKPEKVLTDVEIVMLRKEYNSLKSDYGINADILHEAEQRLVEEISSEGFGGQETRCNIARYEAETQKTQDALDNFRFANPEFMAILKAEAKADAEKAIERLWYS